MAADTGHARPKMEFSCSFSSRRLRPSVSGDGAVSALKAPRHKEEMEWEKSRDYRKHEFCFQDGVFLPCSSRFGQSVSGDGAASKSPRRKAVKGTNLANIAGILSQKLGVFAPLVPNTLLLCQLKTGHVQTLRDKDELSHKPDLGEPV